MLADTYRGTIKQVEQAVNLTLDCVARSAQSDMLKCCPDAPNYIESGRLTKQPSVVIQELLKFSTNRIRDLNQSKSLIDLFQEFLVLAKSRSK